MQRHACRKSGQLILHNQFTGTICRDGHSFAHVARQLTDVFDRERSPQQSTEFSFSRFLVPWLQQYQGWAIFMDCDMLCRGDIAELWALRDERYALQCVQHEHVPREDVKFLGALQTRYEKKNWSSLMLFQCQRCQALTPETDTTTHYFFMQAHKFRLDDATITESIYQSLCTAFEEDRRIIEAQQQMILRTPPAPMQAIAADAALSQYRWLLQRMCEAEAATPKTVITLHPQPA